MTPSIQRQQCHSKTHDLTNPESQKLSCSCQTAKREKRKVQAIYWQENSLQPLGDPSLCGTQKRQCIELLRGIRKRRLRGSICGVLLGLSMFDLFFKMNRPGIRHERPHEQRGGNRKTSLIEKPDRDKTKNERVSSAPKPIILVQYVECNYGDNKKNSLHTMRLGVEQACGACRFLTGQRNIRSSPLTCQDV